MQKKILIFFYGISLLFFVAKTFAHDDSATQRINKVIVQGENVYSYSIDKNRIEDYYSDDKTELRNSYKPISFFVANLSLRQIENYPFTSTVNTNYHQHPFAWDIFAGNFFYISSGELVHHQRSFGLHIVSPTAFEEYKNNPPEKYSHSKKVVYSDGGTHIEFLGHLFIEAGLHQIDARHDIYKKVSYDFYALGTNSADVYAYYTNEPLQLWRWQDNNWTKLATFDVPFEGSFRVFKKNNAVYLLSDSGKLFKVSGVEAALVQTVTLTEIFTNPDIQFVIDDKDKDELFFVTKDKIIPLSRPAKVKSVVIADVSGLGGPEFLKEALKCVNTIYGK